MEQRKILIVEDDLSILEGLQNFFSNRGFAVSPAQDGLEALKLLDRKRFDLVITDLVMPNVSGVGILAIVKQKFPGLPVIAVTGMGEMPKQLAVESEADAVLEKPFDLAVLDKTIQKLIG